MDIKDINTFNIMPNNAFQLLNFCMHFSQWKRQ